MLQPLYPFWHSFFSFFEDFVCLIFMLIHSESWKISFKLYACHKNEFTHVRFLFIFLLKKLYYKEFRFWKTVLSKQASIIHKLYIKCKRLLGYLVLTSNTQYLTGTDLCSCAVVYKNSCLSKII